MALAQALTLDRQQAHLPVASPPPTRTPNWPAGLIAAIASKEFDDPELQALCALWHAKAGGGSAAARGVRSARVGNPLCATSSMLERIGQKGVWRYRFRLFGSGLTQLFGEHTGRYLDEMVSPALLQNWLACFDTTIRYGAPLRFINYYRTHTRDFLKGEIFAAPLAEDVPDQPLVLAATYVPGHEGRRAFCR